MTKATIRTDCIEVYRHGEDVVVRLNRSHASPLGLRVHHAAREGLVRGLLGPAGGLGDADFTARRFDSLSEATTVAARLQRGLDRIARKPIGRKAVEQLLGITSKERLKWALDGRLPPRCRSRWTYASSTIQALLNDPSPIGRWRLADEDEGFASRRDKTTLSEAAAF